MLGSQALLLPTCGLGRALGSLLFRLTCPSCPQVSIAVGCATRDRTVPFCSTFAAFFTRAFDQIRMAAISESNINLCGSHCGVSIGELRPDATPSTFLALDQGM